MLQNNRIEEIRVYAFVKKEWFQMRVIYAKVIRVEMD